jgi:hypothetical protein
MYHPVLKVTAEIPDKSVRVYRKSGWRNPPKPRKLAEQTLDVTPPQTGGDSPREGKE